MHMVSGNIYFLMGILILCNVCYYLLLWKIKLFFNLVEERFAKILAFLYIVVCLLSYVIMSY